MGVVFWASESQMARFTNLRVPQNSLPDVYLQMDVGSRNKCLVSGRAGTTAKRSDSRLAKASWRCRTEQREGAPPVYVADSKQRPSYLFVPFTDVHDLVYPLVYEEIRAGESLDLPALRWVHLYFNRQFAGLYLEVSLPGRFFASQRLEARNAGLPEPPSHDETTTEVPEPERLELLGVVDDALVCFDRKMRPVCPIYNLAVADGVFPRPRMNDGIALLYQLSPPPAYHFILSDESYETLEPFPIPTNLATLLPRDVYRDQRYRRWQTPPAPPEALATRYGARLRDHEEFVQEHLQDLAESIQATCALLPCDGAAEVERLTSSLAAHWFMGS